MGSGSWTAKTQATYSSHSAVRSTKSRSQVFSKSKIAKAFDPKNITIRESCDSVDNPESNAIIVGLDVTGSMGFIAEHIAKKSLGTLVKSIHDFKPVTDPHLMFMAIGDATYDNAPLQATHFEADIRISEQIVDLWLEGGGGGNSYESYDLPWAFAAEKTRIDCFDKRGKKGFLFTMGDELPPRTPDAGITESVGLGKTSQPVSSEDWLHAAQEKYNVFHLIIEEGNYYKYANYKSKEIEHGVDKAWKSLLGKRAIKVNDHKAISEIIVSAMQLSEGHDPKDVLNQWQDSKVQNAVKYSLFRQE